MNSSVLEANVNAICQTAKGKLKLGHAERGSCPRHTSEFATLVKAFLPSLINLQCV